MNQDNKPSHSRCQVALVLLFILILFSYSNSFRASWHFDDIPIIINNPVLKIKNLQPETLTKTAFANPNQSQLSEKRIYRPISCLTLALNWYVGRYNVFGYHLINIIIHCLTAGMLFMTLMNLFNTPKLRDKYTGREYFIALLAASLWAINPIHTQAISYIVQRMAALAAMFYLVSIYLYLKARMTRSKRNRIFLLAGCFLSYFFALGSKENSVTLPLALILVEVIFFQDFNQPGIRKRFVGIALGVGLGIALLGAWLYLEGDLYAILKGYERRYFSPMQRLMTEPRILIFYLSQIFYPVPSRLSIEHHVSISTSLFTPWTTIASIGLVFALIGLAIFQMRKRPILSFAVLFFFLTHLIESTIIGLELIFEHRNYLPSLFIFFPVALGIEWLLDFYRKKKRSMYHILVSSLTLLIIALGIGTYIRNLVWASEKTLWEDAIQKAPEMARPYHNLAWGYYEKTGQYDKAKAIYEKALNYIKHNKHGKALVINNLANYYYLKKDLSKARELWTTTLSLDPKNGAFEYRLAKCLTENNEWKEALVHLDNLLLKHPNHRNCLNLKGLVLLKQKRIREALPNFRRALKLNPNDMFTLTYLGVGFRLRGDYDRAEWFLKTAYIRNPQNEMILLWLIEVNQITNDRDDVDEYMQRLLAASNFKALATNIEKLENDSLMLVTARQKLIKAISAKLKADSKALTPLEDHFNSPLG
jgi:Tfp pilus assembly protein PilF